MDDYGDDNGGRVSKHEPSSVLPPEREPERTGEFRQQPGGGYPPGAGGILTSAFGSRILERTCEEVKDDSMAMWPLFSCL